MSNLLQKIIESTIELLKIWTGIKEISPVDSTAAKLEENLGWAVEEFESASDQLSYNIEEEKKSFLLSFIKYGADSKISSDLIK